MNQTFSLGRWLLLMRRHWMENSKLFLYGTLSLIGLIIITFFLWVLFNDTYNQYDLLVLYVIGLYITGSIFASSSFDLLRKKDKGIYYLSLPASHFEKLLTLIFYNLIFFTLVYSLCYYGLQWLTTLFVKARAAAHPEEFKFRSLDWLQPDSLMKGISYFIFIYFGVQALFFLGSVYFKRYAFLLTMIALTIFLFFLFYYLNSIKHALFPDFSWDGDAVIKYGEMDKIYHLPDRVSTVLKWLCLLGWAPLFWWVAWFRLREKEI